MNSERNEWLYAQCLNGKATTEERAELLAWLALPENEQKAKEWLLTVLNENDGSQWPDDAKTEQMLQAIYETKAASEVPMYPRSRWISYAAAIVLLVAGGWWFLLKQRPAPQQAAVAMQHEILPAKQGALLTLADGRQLVLDSLNNGVIAVQNGASVSLQNGRLSYSGGTATRSALNTIATPRGRKYDILLSDGTHIWLNAASSVTYPVAFTGNDRRIRISGEAYLEVAKDRQRPFIVDVDGRSTVKVLGTSFNIKAYADDKEIQTTLIEGSLNISGALLKPGQQMQVDTTGSAKLFDNVDTEPVLAWKNGIFNFKNADLRMVMRELSRWYDIEVVYKGSVPSRKFQGEIGRDLTLQQVLKGLKSMNVHFDIQGKQILVTE